MKDLYLISFQENDTNVSCTTWKINQDKKKKVDSFEISIDQYYSSELEDVCYDEFGGFLDKIKDFNMNFNLIILK